MEEKFTETIRSVIRTGMMKMEEEKQKNPMIPTPEITLTSLRLQFGHFVIGCADEQSRLWLSNYIKSFRWANAGIPFKIQSGDIREVRTCPTYIITAPRSLDYSQVKHYLEKKHRIRTNKWKLLHTFQVTDKVSAKFLILSDDDFFNEMVKKGNNKQIAWTYYTSSIGITARALPTPQDAGNSQNNLKLNKFINPYIFPSLHSLSLSLLVLSFSLSTSTSPEERRVFN